MKRVRSHERAAKSQLRCTAMPRSPCLLLISSLLSMIGLVRGQIRVLIVDGINNHDWAAATAGIGSILDEVGGFNIDVSTLTPEKLRQWKHNFFKYQVVVNNFNGGHLDNGIRWPESVEKQMEAYVKGGGGLVIYHAANNAFLFPLPAGTLGNPSCRGMRPCFRRVAILENCC